MALVPCTLYISNPTVSTNRHKLEGLTLDHELCAFKDAAAKVLGIKSHQQGL